MKLIHISERFNKESIVKLGLLPGKIKIANHLECFRGMNLCTQDDKILYTWESCDQDTKFIKDMVFCKTWVHPRNEMPYRTDFSKLTDKFLGPYESMEYDVYEVTVPYHNTNFRHVQEASGGIYNSCFAMPDEFAHLDKVLHVFNTPQKDIRIVGVAQFEYVKGQYRITVK